jgi:outer membrane protein assembly factor BamB
VTGVRVLRPIGLLLLAIMLAGCASKGPQPAKLTDFKASTKLKVAWHVDLGDAGYYIFTPAIYADTVFAASNRGDLMRLNASTGKTLWRIDTKAPLSGGVGIGANMVLVGTSKGAVLAYDLASRYGNRRCRAKC